jgi:hypothetical protein
LEWVVRETVEWNAKESDASKEFRQRNPERLCDLLNINQGQVSFAPLNPANVGPIQPAHIGKLLLRHAELLPSLAHGFAKPDSDI